jgi:hypothetical protein
LQCKIILCDANIDQIPVFNQTCIIKLNLQDLKIASKEADAILSLRVQADLACHMHVFFFVIAQLPDKLSARRIECSAWLSYNRHQSANRPRHGQYGERIALAIFDINI